MALRRKGSLADLAARLDKTRADLASVEDAIVTAARERAEAVGQLAEAGFDPVTLTERRASLGAAEAALTSQREALQEAVVVLERRCAALAVKEAEAVVAERRKALVPLADERDRLEARLVAIGVEEAELEEQVADAADAVRWAPSAYSAEARAAAEGVKRQETERVAWIAMQPKWRREAELAGESPRIRRLVDAEIERLGATRAAEQAARRRASEEQLAAVGVDAGRAPGEVAASERFARMIR